MGVVSSGDRLSVGILLSGNGVRGGYSYGQGRMETRGMPIMRVYFDAKGHQGGRREGAPFGGGRW